MNGDKPSLNGRKSDGTNRIDMVNAKVNVIGADVCENMQDDGNRTYWLDDLANRGLSPFVDAEKIRTMETGKPPNVLTFAELRHHFHRERRQTIKSIVRGNAWSVDSPIRVRLWPALCAQHQARHAEMLRPETMSDLYWQMVRFIFETTTLARQPISLPLFVDASHCLPYNLTKTGLAIADRIVTVLAYDYPGITYCPLVYPLTAIMLHYIKEEETYRCMVMLISSRSKTFMTQTKSEYDSTRLTATRLARQYARNAIRYFEHARPSLRLEQIFNEWCWWILAGLPFEHVVRIMDCYLNEGFKIFYRVIFVILELFVVQANQSQVLSTLKSELVLSNAIFNFCHRIKLTPEKLLNECFKIRRFSSANILRIFTAQERQLRVLHYNVLHRMGSSRHDSLHSATETFAEPWHNFVFTLWSWLPDRFVVYKPRLIFKVQHHGYSLQKFYKRVESHQPTLMLIRTKASEVFGAFCSSRWAERHQLFNEPDASIFFGTGETFLFTLQPKCEKYSWVGIRTDGTSDNTLTTNCFMCGDQQMLNIGCGGLWLDGSLSVGRSEHCNTFSNPPLSAAYNFQVQNLEVYGFDT